MRLNSGNQSGIARAEAELERAVRNKRTVANQIVLDVQRAYRRMCSVVLMLALAAAVGAGAWWLAVRKPGPISRSQFAHHAQAVRVLRGSAAVRAGFGKALDDARRSSADCLSMAGHSCPRSGARDHAGPGRIRPRSRAKTRKREGRAQGFFTCTSCMRRGTIDPRSAPPRPLAGRRSSLPHQGFRS